MHTPLKPPATTWPSAMSAYTDWNKDFVEPVQDGVVQVNDPGMKAVAFRCQ